VRDIVLAAFILGAIPFILRRPQLGVIMYVWVSVMNPHRLTWSFAYDAQFAQYLAIATLAGLAFSKDLKRPPMSVLTVSLLLFAAWTGVTTLYALYPSESYRLWEALMKTQLMVMLITMLFHREKDLRILLWVLVISVSYYGTKGGIWSLISGSEARVYGPADSYIADNNSIAVAIVMMIPLMRYLQLTTPYRSVKWGLSAMMVLCGIAVLGTYSRGALLAVCAMAFFLWWKGRHKLSLLIAVIPVLCLGFAAMPERWYERMDTIVNYQEEGSANMRLNSWGTMWNLAKDRPLVGGGFEVASEAVYARYAPDPSFPPQVAHSIYFQVLGEHGFVGLALYLLLFGALWTKAGGLVRTARRRTELDLAWARDFGLMLQVTLVGFAAGGTFLSLVNFDVPYYLVGITAATLAIVEREVRAQEASGSKPATPAFSGHGRAPAPVYRAE
jgi:putative inorganic carbon (hco3(-)) transporter